MFVARFLIWTLLFLAGCAGLAASLMPLIIPIFCSNSLLNGFIGALFLGGTCWGLWVMGRTTRALQHLNSWQDNVGGAITRLARDPLPAPSFLRGLEDALRTGAPLTASRVQGLQDAFETFFQNTHEGMRYLMGSLVFLGLLGTFFGLSVTIQGISEVMSQLPTQNVSVGENFFEALKASLQKPLGGMGTAFGASLFGIAASLLLGFIDLQIGALGAIFLKSLNGFFCSLEEGGLLLRQDKAFLEGSSASPAYLEALLGQVGEHIERLQMTLQETEAERYHLYKKLQNLGDALHRFVERSEPDIPLLHSLGESQLQSQELLKFLVQSLDINAFHEHLSRHATELDHLFTKAFERSMGGQRRAFDELRQEFRLLTKALTHLLGKEEQGY